MVRAGNEPSGNKRNRNCDGIFHVHDRCKNEAFDAGSFRTGHENLLKRLLTTPSRLRPVFVDFLSHSGQRQMKRGEFAQRIGGQSARRGSQCLDGFEASVFKLVA
jgi:hypothetical protein